MAREIRLSVTHLETMVPLILSGKAIRNFVELLLLPMTRAKQTMFMKLWARLDFYRKGEVSNDLLIQNFDARRHPHVNQNRGFKQRADANFLTSEFRRSLSIFGQIKAVLMDRDPRQVSTVLLSEEEFYLFCWVFAFELDSDVEFRRMFGQVFNLN